MSTAKREQYLITTSLKGRTRQQVWDSAEPIALDHPFRWVLERTESGLRVRSFKKAASQVIAKSSIALTQEMLKSKPKLELHSGSAGAAPLVLRIERIESPKAAYVPMNVLPSAPESAANDLVAFSCVGSAVLSAVQVKSSYVGYADSKIAFRVKRLGDGKFELTAVADGIHAKIPSDTYQLNQGEPKIFSAGQAAKLSVIRGSCRWHFTMVPRPELLKIEPEFEADEAKFKRSLTALLSLSLLFAIAVSIVPRSIKPVEELIPPQFAKVVLTRPKANLRAPVVESRAMTVASPGAEVSESEKAAVKDAPKVPTPEIKTAAAPPAAQPVPKIAKAQPQPVKIAKAAPTAKPQVSRSQALQNSMSSLMKGGITRLLAQTEILDKAANVPAAKASLDGKTNAGGGVDMGVALQKLESKLGTLANGTEVAALGGNNSNVGYGKGEHAMVGSGAKAGSKSLVALDTGGATAEQGLTREEVGKVIYQHMSEIRYCYESAMVRNSRVEGKLMVAFTIGKTGVVARSKVQSTTLKDGELDQCVLRRLTTWQFPKPKGGVDVAISYPFLFKTLGGE